jgi:hypothetical protein
MKAFIVVYQHSFRSDKLIQKTLDRNKGNLHVSNYVEEFKQDNSFLDWADDPSFYCSQDILGDLRQTSWGVCRRDVRNQLETGDLVVFFCGKQDIQERKRWKYYFIGFGTIKYTLYRKDIWGDEKYSPYRDFFNILAHPDNGVWVQYEPIGEGHDDWNYRLTAPYIIFDSDSHRTNFNLKNPINVAEKKPDKLLEDWNCDDPKVKELKKILFDQFGIKRNLRTNSKQRPHRQIAIHRTNPIDKTAKLIVNLTNQLHQFME